MMEKEIFEVGNKIGKIKSVDAVYLFGSCASGDVHTNSDIDICIIGDLNKKEKNSIFENIHSDRYDVSFFSELPIWIKIRVFRGKALFIRNKERVYEACFRTLREYFDFKPAITRICGEALCTI